MTGIAIDKWLEIVNGELSEQLKLLVFVLFVNELELLEKESLNIENQGFIQLEVLVVTFINTKVSHNLKSTWLRNSI